MVRQCVTRVYPVQNIQQTKYQKKLSGTNENYIQTLVQNLRASWKGDYFAATPEDIAAHASGEILNSLTSTRAPPLDIAAPAPMNFPGVYRTYLDTAQRLVEDRTGQISKMKWMGMATTASSVAWLTLFGMWLWVIGG